MFRLTGMDTQTLYNSATTYLYKGFKISNDNKITITINNYLMRTIAEQSIAQGIE
jgi:hypothetical protein